MHCSSVFTFSLFLGNAVAILTTGTTGGGVSSSVSTGNRGVLRHNARYPDKDPHTYFVFDYRPAGVIQGCHGFICYGYDGKPSTLPGEKYIEKDLIAWETIRQGLDAWKKGHAKEDAFIYMVDRGAFLPSRSLSDTLYNHIKWSNIKGWARLGHSEPYYGHVIGGYVPNNLFEPYMVKEPRKRPDRSLAMEPANYNVRMPEKL